MLWHLHCLTVCLLQELFEMQTHQEVLPNYILVVYIVFGQSVCIIYLDE